MTHLKQKILTFAMRNGIESPKNVKLISKGVATETYQLQAEDKKYILIRFLRDIGHFQPLVVTKLSKFYVSTGFPIPKIFATGKIEGQNAILTECITGKVKPHWEISNFESLGFLIGNLHAVQREFSVNTPTITLMDDLERLLNNLEDALPESFKIVFDEVEALKKSWPKNLPTGIIHGDIWYKNVLFEKDKISAILDFSFPYKDCLIYDLGTILKGIYFSKFSQECDVKFNAFISQYQLANPLLPEELEALPLMLRAKMIYTIVFMLEQASLHKQHRENFLSTAMFNLLKLSETKEISFEEISL